MSLLHQGLEWIHCLSSAHQHPVAVIRMGCLTSASAKASGWFLPDPLRGLDFTFFLRQHHPQ